MLGINNRNLKTLEVSLETTRRLAPRLPAGRLLVAESGLFARDDLEGLAAIGAKAFLIGESLMRQADVAAATRALLAALRKPRRSGMSELTHFDAEGKRGHGRRRRQGRDRAHRRAPAARSHDGARDPGADRRWQGVEKGDVLAVARLAGIMAAKRTADLIPLCHPLALTSVKVELSLDEDRHAVDIEATCKLTGRTGVEMEALTAVSVAALTVYDMCKAVDRGMRIGDIRLVDKAGGKSGHFEARGMMLSVAEARAPASSPPSRRCRPKSWPVCRPRLGRVLAEDADGPRHPAAGSRSRRWTATPCAPPMSRGSRSVCGWSARSRPAASSRPPSLPASACASSPARRCRRAPTPSSSRRIPPPTATRSRCARAWPPAAMSAPPVSTSAPARWASPPGGA